MTFIYLALLVTCVVLWSMGFDTDFVKWFLVLLGAWFIVLVINQHDEVRSIGPGIWLVAPVCIILYDSTTSLFVYLIVTGTWGLICLLMRWFLLRNAKTEESKKRHTEPPKCPRQYVCR